MSQTPVTERLAAVRRDLHRRAEPAWREFYTTSRILEEVEAIGADEVYAGSETMDTDARFGVPEEAELDRWKARAREAGARESVLEDGVPGVVAVLRRGDGPTVALRVDMDALAGTVESDDADHQPAAEGFAAEHDDAMHACGHDGHAAIGLGVLGTVADSDFQGTFKVFFQPAEEISGGGRPTSLGPHVDDVDYLFAAHLGLDYPTGTVVAGIDEPYALASIAASFRGYPAHAAGAPNAGRNAAQAFATAVGNLYAIPRHTDGVTRVNVGRFEGGTATNTIPERATMDLEVRGGSSDLLEYMKTAAERVIRSAADLHDCEVDVAVEDLSPGYAMDEELVDVVAAVAEETAGVDEVVPWAQFSASEDVAHLMGVVAENGGKATYSVVGTDHPSAHHTSTFDVDERSLDLGVAVLSRAVLRAAGERP